MRVGIFVIGSILLTICIFISLANAGVPLTARTPVPLGYFVVVATAFLATALYRETRAADPIAKYAIYHVLVSQPLSFDELIVQARKQVAQSDGMSFEPKTIQTAVAEMLEKGHLEIKDGLLHLTRP